VTQTYNNCAETHLGDGVMSPFVSRLSAIARAHDPTVIGGVALRKGPWRFWPPWLDLRARHWHYCAKTWGGAVSPEVAKRPCVSRFVVLGRSVSPCEVRNGKVRLISSVWVERRRILWWH